MPGLLLVWPVWNDSIFAAEVNRMGSIQAVIIGACGQAILYDLGKRIIQPRFCIHFEIL